MSESTLFKSGMESDIRAVGIQQVMEGITKTPEPTIITENINDKGFAYT